MDHSIVVAIVADGAHADRIASIATSAPGIQVALTTDSVAALATVQPPVTLVVLDLRLSDGSSPPDTIGALRADNVSVLAMSAGEDRQLIQHAVRAGAQGLVLRSASPAEIVAAIQTVGAGREYVTTDWAAAIDADPLVAKIDMTASQEAVLSALASGESAGSVAQRAHLSLEDVGAVVAELRHAVMNEAGAPAMTRLVTGDDVGATGKRELS